MTPDDTAHQLHISACASERRSCAAQFLIGLPSDAPALLLVPSPNAGLWLMKDVLTPGQARFGWTRRSLPQHCQALARPALLAQGHSYLGPLASQALCARVVIELAEQARLGRFAAVSQQPGFTRALHSTLCELRLARVTPQALAPHDPDLARIAEAFEGALVAGGLADDAALYTLAAARARSQPLAALLALDVPIAHAAEAELVHALAAACDRACVTLPLGDGPSLTAFRAAFPHAREHRTAPAAPADLGRLQARLFEPQAAVTGASDAPAVSGDSARVRFISSPGESRECVEVARAVLEAAAAGIPFDDMAILVRAVDNYRAHLEEALERAAIPAHFGTGVRRPAPEGRAFALLLSCAEHGLCVRRFAEYLSLAVMPRPADEPDTPASPRYWERLLMQAQVGGGSSAWQQQLASLCQRASEELQLAAADDPERERLQRRLSALRALSAFAVPLLSRLEALPERASFRSYRHALTELAEHALDNAGAVQELLETLSPLDSAELGRRELSRLLAPQLQSLIVPSEGHGAGKLQVLPMDEARGRSFARVFVLGLAENLLPPRLREDPLLPDALRARLSPALARMPERVAYERLLLRVAVSGARQQLTLTFPRFDTEHSRPRVPSFYGLEVLEAVEGRLPAWSELGQRAARGAAARLGWPAPEQPEQAIDDAEYDLATIARSHDAGSSHPGALRYLIESNPHLARALRFRARRWELQKFVAADGFVVSDERARDALAGLLQSYEYSPSTLELLAICPYRFYLRALARVTALDQPGSPATIDARERGVLFHQLLHDTLQQLASVPIGSSGRFDPNAAEQALQGALAHLRAQRAARSDAVRTRLLDLELVSLHHDLRGWIEAQSRDGGWVPHASELSFGERRGGHALTIGHGLRLSGAIDLVEHKVAGDPERPELRATDFKTARQPQEHAPGRSGRYITAGARVLQPLLYALALERLFPQARVSSGRLYFCTRDAQYQSHPVELNPRSREIADQLCESTRELVGQGFLPAAPEAQACASCEYQVICGPHEAERVLRVKRDPARLRSLSLLRRLP